MKMFGFDFVFVVPSKKMQKRNPVYTRRTLHLESLENREMLSVGPLLASDFPLLYPVQDYRQSDWFEQLVVNPDSVTEETEGIIENEWIVQLKQESLNNLYSVTKAAEYLDDYGVTVIGGLGSPGTLHVQIDVDSVELQNEILAGIFVLDYYEQNYVILSSNNVNALGTSFITPEWSPVFGTEIANHVNDPGAYLQWYLDTINVLPAWEKTTGQDTVVAVIDTGIRFDDPDMTNIWTNPNEVPNGIDDDENGLIDDIHGWDFYSGDSNPTEEYQHGSEIATIIAANRNNNLGLTGIAPDTKILPIRIGNKSGMTAELTIQAINYVILLKTKYHINICAINASFSKRSPSTTFLNAIESAGNAGIVVVASVANDASNNDVVPVYPSNYNNLDNVISVAATTDTDLLCSFSNYGIKTVDLAAPGDEIYIDYIEDQYGSTATPTGGTSSAAPMVTGTVALLASLHPDWTPAQIKEAILETVDYVPALDGKVKTGGRLNIGDAVNYDFTQAPTAPLDLSVLLQTDGFFQLKWKDNSKNETSFEVQYSLDNGVSWSPVSNLNISRNNTTATFTLGSIGSYQFQIRAVNSYGDNKSAWSNTVSIVKDTATPPSAPTGLFARLMNEGLSISWDTVSGADNYRLERISYNENDWKEIYFGTNPSFYDDGVIPSKTYSYRVYTISGGIVSNPSPVKLGTAPAQFPNTPTGITIITLDANSVQFIWGDVKYAQFYHIERYDSKKKDWVEIAQTTVASFTDTKLQPTTTYSYRIRAENGGLKSDYAEITIATLGPAPKAPTSVKGVAEGNSVVLTWKSANGATAYHVEYSLTGKADSWETVLLSSPTSTGGTITDLEYCTKYYFRVYSMSDSGQSEKPSSTINITTPPETPEHLTLTNITDKTATLTWDAVANTTGYRIEKYYNGKWSSAGTAKAGVTEYTVKSLKALTDYKFRVIALNKSVKSETSNEVVVTTPYAMTTTITKSGFALKNGNDFSFMFSGKTPQGNIKTIPTTETFQYELIVSASTKTDKNSGELLIEESISLGKISVTLSSDSKTYTTEPILFSGLGAIPNITSLTTLKTIQFQLKVTNPTSTSTFQRESTFYSKVAKLTLPKWFV